MELKNKDYYQNLYWGSRGVERARDVSRFRESTKVSTKNYYGWEMEYIGGLDEHVKLKSMSLGSKVEVLVYRSPNENALIPHLDIAFPTQDCLHLTSIQMVHLGEVIEEAKKILLSNSLK